MRLCNNAVLAALLLAGAVLTAPAQTQPANQNSNGQNAPAQAPSLSEDRDPVRSPDVTAPETGAGPLSKQGGGYVLRTDVEEVVLNCTVLDGNRLVQDLKGENFQVLEDGTKQNIISFQHTDLPVSIAVVIDNSGSMYRKRPSVNKSAMDLIAASNPRDEAFVVNFSDEAFIDQDFTSDVNKLRDGLSHIDSRGGTALYDAVVASADKLVADAKRPKQVIVLITDGEDNASTLNLEQTIRRVQELSGPVIYTIGLLFWRRDEPRRGAPCAAGAGDAVDGNGAGWRSSPSRWRMWIRLRPRWRGIFAASTRSATTRPSRRRNRVSGACR